MGLRIQLLGKFSVWRDNKPVKWAKGEKPKLLLKVLLTEPGRTFSHDELIEQLWPDKSPEQETANLLNRVSELRRILQPGLKNGSYSKYILTRHLGFCFNSEGSFIDAQEFQRHYHQAKHLEASGDFLEAVQEYESAIGLFKGDYLEDDKYEDWLLGQREHFRGIYLDMLSSRADRCAQLGDYPNAISCCKGLLEKDASNEGACRRLMLYYSYQGERGKVLEAYHACREAMASLGTRPSPETEQLREQILDGEVKAPKPLADPSDVAAWQTQELKRALESMVNALKKDVKGYQNENGLRLAGHCLGLLQELESRGVAQAYFADKRFSLLSLRADIYNTLGRREDQKKDIEELFALAQGAEDDMQLSEAHLKNSILLRYTGKLKEAKAGALESLAIWKRLGDKKGQAEALNNIGIACEWMGLYPEALGHYRQLLALSGETGDRAMKVNAVYNMGTAYAMMSQLEKSLEHYRQALPLYRELGEKRGEGLVFQNTGVVYKRQGQYGKALRSYRQALKLFEGIGYRKGVADIHTNAGNIQWFLGRYKDAETNYRKAISIYREIGERRLEANALDALGTLFNARRKHQEALEHYLKAHKLMAGIGNKALEASILIHIGDVYQYLGDPGKGLDYFEKALAISRELGSKLMETLAIHGKAANNLMLRDAREALACSTQLVKMLAGGYEHPEPATAYLLHFKALSMNGKDAEALEHLRRAHAELTKRAESIEQPKLREKYLKSGRVNREIVSTYRKLVGGSGA